MPVSLTTDLVYLIQERFVQNLPTSKFKLNR